MHELTTSFEGIHWLRTRTSLIRDSAEQAVLTLDNFVTSTEEQEGAGSICALGFSLVQTFVSDQGTLLVTNKATDGDTFERAVGNFAIDLRGRHKLGQDATAQAEEIDQRLLPLQCRGVEKECS